MSDKSWLADKLKQGRDALWHEPQTQRYSFTHGAPHLVQAPGTRTDAGALDVALEAWLSYLQRHISITCNASSPWPSMAGCVAGMSATGRRAELTDLCD